MGTNVILNGKLSDINKAVIPVTDRGFLYGDGVFETLRIYDGFPFQLKAHLNRLDFSAKQLDIALGDKEEIQKQIKRLTDSNNIKDGIARITVTRGTSKQRALLEEGLQPNILIQTHELPEYPESIYKRGVNIITIEDNRSELCHIKHTNLLPNMFSKKQAGANKAFEAVLISKRGFVTEGATSNVFGLIDDTLITPPPSKKVLNGITRQVVIKIAHEFGFRVEEDALMGHELSIVKELFITNSVIEVLPVTLVDGKMVGDGHVGQTTSKLMNGYKTVVNNWLKTLKVTAQ